MIYYMVTGKNASGTLVNAGQTLTRLEALVFREEDRLGSMEAGKLGDVVVLSDDVLNPAKVPDEALKALKSVLTVVAGKVVYDKLN